MREGDDNDDNGDGGETVGTPGPRLDGMMATGGRGPDVLNVFVKRLSYTVSCRMLGRRRGAPQQESPTHTDVMTEMTTMILSRTAATTAETEGITRRSLPLHIG